MVQLAILDLNQGCQISWN